MWHYTSDSKKSLLKFADEVINQCNEERVTSDNEFLMELMDVNGRKMFKIFTPLHDDFPESFASPCYVSPEEFKQVLEIWIREEEKFYKNPEQYAQDMLRQGATILRPADFNDSAVVKRKMDAEKFCLIEDWRETKSDKPEVLPRESPAKGKTGEPSHPWWQFWK